MQKIYLILILMQFLSLSLSFSSPSGGKKSFVRQRSLVPVDNRNRKRRINKQLSVPPDRSVSTSLYKQQSSSLYFIDRKDVFYWFVCSFFSRHSRRCSIESNKKSLSNSRRTNITNEYSCQISKKTILTFCCSIDSNNGEQFRYRSNNWRSY